jgi:hypothetical protein
MAMQAHTVPWRSWCDLDAFAHVLGDFRMGNRCAELLLLPPNTCCLSAG